MTMMANVIATVLYNTQVSQTRLEKLSRDLSALSLALAGGGEMHDVLDRVVETMMRVLGAEPHHCSWWTKPGNGSSFRRQQAIKNRL